MKRTLFGLGIWLFVGGALEAAELKEYQGGPATTIMLIGVGLVGVSWFAGLLSADSPAYKTADIDRTRFLVHRLPTWGMLSSLALILILAHDMFMFSLTTGNDLPTTVMNAYENLSVWLLMVSVLVRIIGWLVGAWLGISHPKAPTQT